MTVGMNKAARRLNLSARRLVKVELLNDIHALKHRCSSALDLPTHPDAVAIVTIIITLAHGLNLQVIAEGVETEAQQKLLRDQQFDEVQGLLFSDPMSADEIPAFLSRADACVQPLGEHAWYQNRFISKPTPSCAKT